MRTITTTELKENFDKYLELGQIEEIKVVHNGEYIFTIVPNKEKLKLELVNLFGLLPKEANDDNDFERE